MNTESELMKALEKLVDRIKINVNVVRGTERNSSPYLRRWPSRKSKKEIKETENDEKPERTPDRYHHSPKLPSVNSSAGFAYETCVTSACNSPRNTDFHTPRGIDFQTPKSSRKHKSTVDNKNAKEKTKTVSRNELKNWFNSLKSPSRNSKSKSVNNFDSLPNVGTYEEFLEDIKKIVYQEVPDHESIFDVEDPGTYAEFEKGLRRFRKTKLIGSDLTILEAGNIVTSNATNKKNFLRHF